ncbi:SDR family oxidoreductase [Nocardia sp. CDC159]|uniref:3-oxoacyl-[acyl-carrier-protein] reductase MabA n=1 Tax=Nocardia pulmonis TaxID=2951408 RepID=A0A9X2E773_9NOCA|nr:MULTISPECIES: SDR family oxidoreductase [Nocardia]MCM6772768.1 SDR family oxidoreductase [Nocardia pulmonis]MCM6785929.1 SDR family oxidoreductase [Nocardia sp. CDC159]
MILDTFRLDGRVAVVTGAGRGIGAATALALAEAGADVAIAARTTAQLDQVTGKIRALGRRAISVPCDLSDLDAVTAFAETAAAELGRIDIVVNNVGGTMPNTFLTTTPEFLEEAFRFNVSTAHALTRAAVPHMLRGDGGSVVNISSMMGRAPGRGFLAYGTAKAALAHWTRLAATDLAPRIRVNAIAVGSVLTSALEIVARQPEVKATMEAATPLHRLGEPWEIAAGIVYLCSPAGGYLTGKVLEIDGGIESPNLELGLPDL